MARLTPLTREELSVEQEALYDGITQGPRGRGTQHFSLTAPDGSLQGPFDLMLRSVAVGGAQQELGAAIRYRTALTDRAREIAILLVAAHWSSRFERDSHEAIGRSMGLSDTEISAIRAGRSEPFTGEERVIADTTLALLGGDLSDTEWAVAHAALGIQGVFDLTALVGYYSTLALQLRVFRVD